MVLYGYQTIKTASSKTTEATLQKVYEMYQQCPGGETPSALQSTGLENHNLFNDVASAANTTYEGTGIHHSVSHSDHLWCCLIGRGNGALGLDIEKIRPVPYEKMAARFFTEAETDYVKAAGLGGFFTLWTAKEALTKYLQRPLMEVLSQISLVTDREDEMNEDTMIVKSRGKSAVLGLRRQVDDAVIRPVDICVMAAGFACTVCYHRDDPATLELVRLDDGQEPIL